MNDRFKRSVWIALPLILAALLIFTIAMADDAPVAGNSAPASPQKGQMPPSANDSLFAVINAGFESIKSALEQSCYDCHSDKTHYPWYYKLPIIKGLIDSDIKGARKNVDFSKGFPFTGKGSQAEMLSDMRDEIAEGGMPIMTYRMIHWGRLIEPPLRDTVFAWIDSSLDRLATVGIVPAKKEAEGDD